MNKRNKLVVFQDKKIRRVWHENEWFFSVVDVVEALTDSPTPRQYWGKVKKREFDTIGLSPIWVQLKLESADGKKYSTDCANIKSTFRIIQSIPSKKAEPFKKWLAQVGYERIREIENPELAQERIALVCERNDVWAVVGANAIRPEWNFLMGRIQYAPTKRIDDFGVGAN